MRLWRLSTARFARSFDGGYGLRFDGRWNTAGRPVTYCATSPSLCVLEKLVHIEDPRLLPALVMVAYEAPDDLAIMDRSLAELPPDWRRQEALTQGLGNAWAAGLASPLLRVPSAILPIANTPDLNLVVNHRHPEAARITLASVEDFSLDPRLLAGLRS